MTTRLSRLVLPFVLAAALGCGDDENAGTSGGSGGTSATAATSATSDGTAGGTGGSDAHKVCEAHCACEGCSGNWVNDCAALREQTRPGCEAEWDTFYACLVDVVSCSNGSFAQEGCGPQDSVLRDCVLGQGSSG